MSAEKDLLQVQDLKISFQLPNQKIEAVKGISFAIKKGEILGIVGESGSGKSVTALSILQLLAKNADCEGAIHYFEEEKALDLLANPKIMQSYQGNRISMIFQEPMSALNPVFRCGEQVIEALQIHQKIKYDEAKKISLDWFQKVKLDDSERIFQSYPHQLSGGQLQRVMIAMSMCCQPDLLIADEPTTALDVQVQKAILELIRELQKVQKMSVLFISHDLGVVAELANRVLVMRHGKIVETASVDQIFNHPQHPYTKGLLASRPPLDRKLYRLPTIEDFENSTPPPTITEDKIKTSEISLLKVDNLKVHFPNQKNFFGRAKSYVKAVDDVSFEIKKGESVALVGESGSGKTTLGRAILRLVTAQSGSVLFEQRSVLEADKISLRNLRQQMQIIFQNPYAALNPKMPIGYSILEPMKVHAIPNARERSIELLETVGLEADHFSRYPHEFSGGQRQRICIARALSLKPSFIVCDECVSSLDVSVQAQILNLLKDLQEKMGLSYLFITHDLSVVRFISDRILIMKSGKIVESGSTEQIFDHPKTDYTKQLLEAIPRGQYQ